MYRMSIMTMLAPQTLNVDLANCMRMALIHDMAEALVGDIIPDENVPKRDKSKAERDTMEYIAKQLLPKVGNGLTGMDILKIWDEYEIDETVDAHFVHDVDKMELMLQLLEYEKRTGMFLDEYNGVEKGIRSAEVKEWCDEVQKDREQLRLAKGLPSHLAKAT
jgi:putative hydrolases of HD superfamily